ncbi:MAG: hypothetical protein HRU15_00085 [Planctomycetes bacterium]|nr:hypothetical protein [Planctomycetota bacterium]
MISFIHEIIYDYRWVSYLIAIPGLVWALYGIFMQLTGAKPEPMSRRQTNKMQAQQYKVSTATIAKTSTGGVRKEEEGSQANLLDSLATEEIDDVDGVDELDQRRDTGPSEFQNAQTVTNGIDPQVLDKLIDDVTDKVASQLEDITGQSIPNDLTEAEKYASTTKMKSVDIQDMLETVEEDENSANRVEFTEEKPDVDIQDMLETIEEDSDSHAVLPSEDDADQSPIVEGEHTAAIRKASRMEEIGFHRTEESEEGERTGPSAFEEAAAALLGDNNLDAKHYDRLGELGLIEDREGTVHQDDGRMRTAQIDDILGRLDDVLDDDQENIVAERAERIETESVPSEANDGVDTATETVGDEIDSTEAEEEVDEYQDDNLESVAVETDVELNQQTDEQRDTKTPFNLAETVHMDDEDDSGLYDNPLHNVQQEEDAEDKTDTEEVEAYEDDEAEEEIEEYQENDSIVPVDADNIASDDYDQIDTARIDNNDDEDGQSETSDENIQQDDDEADDFFNNVIDENIGNGAADETIQEDLSKSDNKNDSDTDADDNDEQQVDDVVGFEPISESAETFLSKEEEGAETVAVARDISDDDDSIDPNLDTVEDESSDDDLPAWARADSFDEDIDEDDPDTPKQQKLF